MDKAKLATSQALRHRVVHVYLAEANVWSAGDICQLRRLRRLSACRAAQGVGQKGLCNVCVSSFCIGSIAGESASNHFIGCWAEPDRSSTECFAAHGTSAREDKGQIAGAPQEAVSCQDLTAAGNCCCVGSGRINFRLNKCALHHVKTADHDNLSSSSSLMMEP